MNPSIVSAIMAVAQMIALPVIFGFLIYAGWSAYQWYKGLKNQRSKRYGWQ